MFVKRWIQGKWEKKQKVKALIQAFNADSLSRRSPLEIESSFGRDKQITTNSKEHSKLLWGVKFSNPNFEFRIKYRTFKNIISKFLQQLFLSLN